MVYCSAALRWDPQANLTAMFLDQQRIEELWPDGDHPDTIYGAILPILKGTGDIHTPKIEKIDLNLGLMPGDLGLSRFEDRLSDAWPRCHNRDASACARSFFIARVEKSRTDPQGVAHGLVGTA